MEKVIISTAFLLFAVFTSYCLAAAKNVAVQSPKENDPFLSEFFPQQQQQQQQQPEHECGEPEGDGLMFSCEHRHQPIVVVDAGAPFTLNCSISGSRNPTVYWKRNGKVILKGSEHGAGRPFLRTELLHYTVDCATPKDAGVYTCIAQADGVTIRRKTTVFVAIADSKKENNGAAVDSNKCVAPTQKVPPKIYASTETVFDAPGASVRLICRATGSPSPSITWHRREADMSFKKIETAQDGYVIESNKDLLLPPLSLEPIHFAEYKCEAKNDAGEDSATTYIQVMPLGVQEELTMLSPSKVEPAGDETEQLIDNNTENTDELLALNKRLRNRHQPLWDISEDNIDTHEISDVDLENSRLSLASLLERLEQHRL